MVPHTGAEIKEWLVIGMALRDTQLCMEVPNSGRRSLVTDAACAKDTWLRLRDTWGKGGWCVRTPGCELV